MNVGGKKSVFEKVVFCVWKVYFESSKKASNMNQAEEIFRIPIFQDLMKKASSVNL